MNRAFLFVLTAGIAVATLTRCANVDPEQPNADPFWPTRVPKKIVFIRDVKPILEVMCLECHNSVDAHLNAGLNFETRRLALSTGRNPPVIQPGEPEASRMIQLLKLDPQHAIGMPPGPDKIWGVRMKIFEKWIAQGMDWPADVRLQRPQDSE